jgi:hypothetical protein
MSVSIYPTRAYGDYFIQNKPIGVMRVRFLTGMVVEGARVRRDLPVYIVRYRCGVNSIILYGIIMQFCIKKFNWVV